MAAATGGPLVPQAIDAVPIDALSGPALRSLRADPVGGLSRRALLRRSLGLGVALWATEVLGGSLSFVWSAMSQSSARVRIGTLADLIEANPGIPVVEGFPAYVAAARSFVVVLDPSIGAFLPGTDATGDGGALNVRALSQVCPHLGCRPNPCIADFWFHCPCHQSRYDRLGIKPAGTRYGPAARSMDRHPLEVDGNGVLTVDTAHKILGPLPIALGQPGLIPARVEGGCG